MSPAEYLTRFDGHPPRELLAELTAARRELQHNGKRSWLGREARKTIAAIKELLAGRGITFSPGPEPAESLAEVLARFPEPKPADRQ